MHSPPRLLRVSLWWLYGGGGGDGDDREGDDNRCTLHPTSCESRYADCMAVAVVMTVTMMVMVMITSALPNPPLVSLAMVALR